LAHTLKVLNNPEHIGSGLQNSHFRCCIWLNC